MIWPEGTRESQKAHALKHVKSLEFAIALCKRRRTAVQAGGNVGLWPLRMAKSFDCVVTFEPETVTRTCLVANTAQESRIQVRSEALGETDGHCSIERASLGSHSVIAGSEVEVVPLDKFGFACVDLLQLDIEGYELQALRGARETIQRSWPVIQVELRDFTARYGASDAEVIGFLTDLGYHEVGRQPGNDVIFRHG